MKIGEENLKKIQFDCVNIGKKQKKQDNETGVLIAKFNPSYRKDIVLRHTKNLDKTKRYGVNQQLPRELEERKKHLLPQYHEAGKAQKKPKWAMEKLTVDSKVTQVKKDCVRDKNINTTDIATTMAVKTASHRTYKKSTFHGHHTITKTQDDIHALHAIYAVNSVARANHNIYAYRLEAGSQLAALNIG